MKKFIIRVLIVNIILYAIGAFVDWNFAWFAELGNLAQAERVRDVIVYLFVNVIAIGFTYAIDEMRD